MEGTICAHNRVFVQISLQHKWKVSLKVGEGDSDSNIFNCGIEKVRA